MLTANLALFLTASLALIVAPGPDSLYVLARGIGQGRRAGAISALGTSTGLLVHTTAAALGLAVLLQTSIVAYTIIKFVGAAYLIYLGVKTFLSKQSMLVTPASGKPSWRRMYLQGMLTNVLNPKVALFFVAFLPQFVDQHSGTVALHMLLLGVIFASLALAYLLLVAGLSGSLGTFLNARPAWASRLRWLTGSVMIGLGLRLALPDRR
ncbi:MAG TPA: LysE family translocator [Ktedonobacterales bacterium]|nr:LysE family translocator [Ktedonobacterales bacterium]